MFTRWMRFHLRKILKPIPREIAERKKQRLAILYAFCCWNLVGFSLYAYLQSNFPPTELEEKDKSRWFIRLLQLENVKVHKMSGFTVQRVDHISDPGELVVDGKVIVKKEELNPNIHTKLD